MVMRKMGKQHVRVYSLQPRNLVRSVFARKYVGYLFPALTKIYEEIDEDHSKSKLEKLIGYQVNLAMALSASSYQFAWSRALKQKLQTNFLLKYGKILSLPRPHVPRPLKFLQNPNCKYMSNRVRRHFLARKLFKNGNTKKRKEAQIISMKLSFLRRLLPGGDEMGDNELLKEVGSYITCLQLQVNILRGLVGLGDD